MSSLFPHYVIHYALAMWMENKQRMMFNNEVTAASRYSGGGAPGLGAIVCPGIDQCGNVAEGEQGAFLCSKVLTEGLLCEARPKSPVCILRET